MRKSLTALVLVALVATSGCAAMRGRRNPNAEFTVARSAPLIVPPDFNLAPPVTGTSGLSPADAQQQAIDTLFGGPAPRSLGEMSLLDQANRDMAPIGIRSTVWDPDTRIVDKGATTLSILSAQPSNSNVASAQAGQ
jgi:DUF3035 family protein